MTRRLRDLLRRLPDGWRVAGTTGSGHLRLAKPGRKAVVTSATPGDHRTIRNVIADVRRSERLR